ncbi:pantoate--beta-alanine ligase [Pararhodospirillum oryzae]|uniref:Pantothenate synthetase n=1 Tax=Pararhodospirillum oryzae TaxID=478448 RepID=A0A512HC42_9PROT|nr:pantoate--beta-alanine ligase [Pararhodospirillum oryzae]GEO82960.1 pantothenate synthetase [Pararhodospirillum oryzae]
MTAVSELPLSLALPVAREGAAVRRTVAQWRAEGLRVALVPTMGALHDGHVSLVRLALTQADRVVVSVFVNPTQFGPSEDFAAYPRTEAADAVRLSEAGAHLMYAPTVEDMYPPGFATTITVEGVSRGLCGDRRPGHFQGVATVVSKLLMRAQPDVAVFGEKDYQQLQVIRRLVADLDLPVEVIGAPVVREDDGLALSSRNAYLSPGERAIAPHLHRILVEVTRALTSPETEAGTPAAVILARGEVALRAAGFDDVEYLELRDASTLAPQAAFVRGRPARLLAAVRLGRTRLIDNMAVEA